MTLCDFHCSHRVGGALKYKGTRSKVLKDLLGIFWTPLEHFPIAHTVPFWPPSVHCPTCSQPQVVMCCPVVFKMLVFIRWQWPVAENVNCSLRFTVNELSIITYHKCLSSFDVLWNIWSVHQSAKDFFLYLVVTVFIIQSDQCDNPFVNCSF